MKIRGRIRSALITVLLLSSVSTVFAIDREYGVPQFMGEDFLIPSSIAYDEVRDRVFVLLAGSHEIRYVSLTDALASGPWHTLGRNADRLHATALVEPQGIAVDPAGNVFVADTFNNKARLYRYSADSDSYSLDTNFTIDTLTSVAGVAIDRPRDIATGNDGAVYLLDSGNQRILRASDANARSWTVHYRDAGLSHAHGLAVGPSGDIYIADTDNHRIVIRRNDGSVESFGRFGSDRNGLRYPNDVAIDNDGRIYVADTHNHRISIYDASGRYSRSLGRSPLNRNSESLAVGSDRKLFIADSERSDVIAYLGPGYVPQFDGYLRDNEADTGVEPSTVPDVLASPDILVRLHPDVDLERAHSEGLASYGSEAAIPGGEYFLYFSVNNLGPKSLPPGGVRVYTSPIDNEAPYYQFPDEWRNNETFSVLRGVTTTENENLLPLSEVAPPETGGLSRAVLGPLAWRPSGSTTECDSNILVMARHVSLHDPIIVGTNNGLEQARESNDVAVLRVPFVGPDCIPRPDRYETNDELATAVEPTESWQHLHARCPYAQTRRSGDPYPDTRCEGIFEDGVAPRFAEEIWTRDITDLSLHGTGDVDFFRIELPEIADPAYMDNDINPAHIRARFAGRPDYEPAVMPECGAVQRVDPGPVGANRNVWVNISTELVLEVVPEGPPDNDVSPRPVTTDGEQIHAYVENDGRIARDPEIFTGSALRKRITCPQDVHNLYEIVFSFGERENPDGSPSPRELLATGGYKLSASYVSTIERGTPEWAQDPGVTGRLNCSGVRPFSGSGGHFPFGIDIVGLPGNFGSPLFPLCGISDFDRFGFFERHPRVPTPNCIADGPGCFSTYFFYWPEGNVPFDMAFAAERELLISLIDKNGDILTETQLSPNSPPAFMKEFKGVDLSSLRTLKNSEGLLGGTLRIDQLTEGYYGLKIEGVPSDFALSFMPIIDKKDL